MKIFSDHHHSGLTQGLIMLFEDRLGHELYFPKGMEWYKEGWVKFMNKKRAEKIAKNVLSNEFHDKMVTFEEFKGMEFDVILCTYPLHDPLYTDLRDLYQRDAAVVAVIGNCHQKSELDNVMISTSREPLPSQNFVRFHQEFDLNMFRYVKPKCRNKIRCYLRLKYAQEKAEYLVNNTNLKFYHGTNLYGGSYKMYRPITRLARAMIDSAFTWHPKNREGYGHIYHNSFACGRPVMIKFNRFRKFAGGVLFEDMVTGIDINSRTSEELKRDLEYCLQPDVHDRMCRETRKSFDKHVDFEKDAMKVKEFLKRCQT